MYTYLITRHLLLHVKLKHGTKTEIHKKYEEYQA